MRSYDQQLAPPIWARGGHAQTILGHVLPSPGRQIGAQAGDRRLEVEVSGGDRLIGFEYAPLGARLDPSSGPQASQAATSPATAERPVRAHLFHGLSGDVNAEYMRRTAGVMTAAGFEVWAFNHRGTGDGAGLASGIYHSGRSDDLAAVLAASRADQPDQTQLVIGFSLSGNAALKLAAELADDPSSGLDGLLAVNPPVDLLGTSRRIHSGLNRLYEARFVRRLRRTLASRPGAAQIPRGASLWEVDELVTAPLGGFKDARDYYARCSTIERLDAIRIPTVIVTAADDPFVDAEPLRAAPRSASVHLHIEPAGGHVGYLSGTGPLGLRPSRWLDGALVFYARELVRTIQGAAAPADH